MMKNEGPRPSTTQARTLNEKRFHGRPPSRPAGDPADRQIACRPAEGRTTRFLVPAFSILLLKKPENWRDRQSHYRDENRSSNPSEENPPILRLPEKKPDESEFEKTRREFIVAQKASNDFVKNQFYNLKTKVKQGQKNHQAVIQDLETKFDKISNHQSSRPTGTLPSNTQTNLKPSTSNDKPYRPLPARNEHVNAVFTRSGIREDRATFLIDKAMQHSHLNYDTCFRMDVIDEVTKDELDALLDDSKPFLSTSKRISETSLDKEFVEFMTENVQEDEVKENFEELPPKDELRIKTSIQDPPIDLEMKPLPKHLEYAFLEENSLLPVVISALLEQNEKERLILVLKNRKEAFAWKTSNILGISPSFCKHKINFEDDVKPVIQRQRRLNPKMKEVKKEIIKLLDAVIIYAIEDSPWVSPVHCIPKKGGITVVTNEDNELVPTRTVTG
ncbi:hypothetical protein Tco_1394253 [Tanacetum coccineum]